MMRNLTHSLRSLLAALAVAAVLLAACGGDDDDATDASGSAPADSDSGSDDASTDSGADAGGPVTIVDFDYDPVSVTVAPGTDVEFTNQDGTAHTATADDNSFNSGSIGGGESGTVTAPDEPGEYPYFCAFHPFMKGTLVVE